MFTKLQLWPTHFALEKHPELHHFISVARAFEGLFLIHVLSGAFAWGSTNVA